MNVLYRHHIYQRREENHLNEFNEYTHTNEEFEFTVEISMSHLPIPIPSINDLN